MVVSANRVMILAEDKLQMLTVFWFRHNTRRLTRG
ncbi:hypothetical protein AALP_AA4G066100 [Arabis alpina]|uniref:Uncharacterized protein n=1 Tax=Arabis alpina TaxID=50452 RepID=A0A087H1K9_ARAAL|nr:hypothetical protein AALP_AA4G066100 [Arabis alpina]